MFKNRIVDAPFRSAPPAYTGKVAMGSQQGPRVAGSGAAGSRSGPPSLLSRQMKAALTEIIQLATLDSDPWVLMVADILKSFPDTGSLNLDLEEQNPNVQDVLGELREKGACVCGPCREEGLLPLRLLSRRGLDLGCVALSTHTLAPRLP